ncbi:MAG: acyl-CoA thioesterase [Chloroflexota bacterium]|nr:acyl-CoA thioesterase [Chloroflexota bacterium]
MSAPLASGQAEISSAPPRFAAYFRVRHYEADALGHVNNATYLHYLEQAAIEHSAALGYTLERYRQLGALFIVRRHEIEYLQPAAPGEIVQVVTWAVEMQGARATRAYEVYRYGVGQPAGGSAVPPDGFLGANDESRAQLLVRARTLWVYIDVARGRPRRIPEALTADFLGA